MYIHVCVCPSNASHGSRNATEKRFPEEAESCFHGRFSVNQRMLWNAISQNNSPQKKKQTK